jgi:hypothetical protein
MKYKTIKISTNKNFTRVNHLHQKNTRKNISNDNITAKKLEQVNTTTHSHNTDHRT